MQSPDIYISHASADLGWVNGVLGSALDRAGVKWTAESRFAAGTERVTAIGDAIQSSRILVLVFSSAYLADDWKQYESVLIEMMSVKKNRARILPILKDSVTIPFALQRFKAIDFTDASNTHGALVSLFSALDGNNQLSPDKKPLCPYPGLFSFDESKSEYFFGRSREIRDLVNHLRRHNFVVVIGASGTGKSSLVRAGLPAALRASSQFGDAEWNVLTMRPGAHPLDTLRALLKTPPYNQSDSTANAEPIPNAVKPQNFLLIVDALEEELTLVRAETDRQEFERALLELLRMPNWYIVATMRSDFYLQFRDSLLRDELLAHQLQLGPLDAEGLREAIREPARKVQVYIDEALVERLVSDAESDEGGSVLPLVQETLVRLWEIGLVERHLPLSAYSKIPGGLNGVLSEHAEQTFAELVTDEKKEIARRIFLRLIQVNDAPPDTRRPVTISELLARFKNQERFQETLEHLSRNRLVNSGSAPANGNPQVDLAHEKLIDKWDRLAKWIERDRVGLRHAQALTQDAVEWEQHQRATSFLYRDLQLQEITPWARAHIEELNETEQAFLEASYEADKRTRLLVSGAIVTAALVVLGVLIMMVMQWGPFAPRLVWQRVAALPRMQVSDLTMDDTGNVYVGFGDDFGIGEARTSIARVSSDVATVEWLDINQGRPSEIVVESNRPSFLYATFEAQGLWRSTDAGKTWGKIGAEVPFEVVSGLVISSDGILYAADRLNAVYWSDNHGDAWHPVENRKGGSAPQPWLHSLYSGNGKILLVTIRSPFGSGRNQLWELTSAGWVIRNDYPSTGVSSAVWTGDTIFSAGKNLTREDTNSIYLKDANISALDVTREPDKKILVATGKGEMMLVRARDGETLYRATSAVFNDSDKLFAALTDFRNPNVFWIGATNGLYRGEILDWFRFLLQTLFNAK